MKIVVSGTKSLFEELVEGTKGSSVRTIYVETADEFLNHADADAYFDLGFENSTGRKKLLSTVLPKLVFINAVSYSLTETNDSFVRINGWTTFLKRSIIEASADNIVQNKAEQVLASLNKKIDWVPDIPGFISARVISMIVNEAYFALEEGVSTKAEIDIAMKLGTNYPYGPFEWSERVGLKNIYELLTALSKTNSHYKPASSLTKEAT
jgi:3-hydroxybutyryl-CoA dehydrogenase